MRGGGAYKTGTIVSGYPADKPSASMVVSQCGGTVGNYNFQIGLSRATQSKFAGKSIFIHAIAENNPTIQGSGTYSIPVPAPNFAKLKSDCYQPSSANSIFTKDSFFTGANWNDPSVLKVGNQYIMYASSTAASNDPFVHMDVGVYRLVSKDAIQWTLSPTEPVLRANPDPAAWDHKAVETPSVVHFNGKYHLFYTGYPITYQDSQAYKIGHATSVDGVNWVRTPGPILGPTKPYTAPNLDFNQYVVGEPGAVVYQNKIYLYFTAVGANASIGSTLQVIGLSTSSDGVSWSAPQTVLTPDQTLYPRSRWVGYTTPSAIVLDGKMHLYYAVAQDEPWKQLRVHHAQSPDGVTGWVQDAAPIFSNTDFPWTSEEIRSPSLLLIGTNLMLWFAGNTPTVLGIGHARCNLL